MHPGKWLSHTDSLYEGLWKTKRNSSSFNWSDWRRLWSSHLFWLSLLQTPKRRYRRFCCRQSWFGDDTRKTGSCWGDNPQAENVWLNLQLNRQLLYSTIGLRNTMASHRRFSPSLSCSVMAEPWRYFLFNIDNRMKIIASVDQLLVESKFGQKYEWCYIALKLSLQSLFMNYKNFEGIPMCIHYDFNPFLTLHWDSTRFGLHLVLWILDFELTLHQFRCHLIWITARLQFAMQ